MSERKDGLADWGEYALSQLRGPVATGFRKRLAAWRDPRARLLRQRKRAKYTTVAGATTSGVLGGSAYLSLAPDGTDLIEAALDVVGLGLGGTALATAVGTVGVARYYRRLKHTPLPEAQPEPVELPPPGSQAREPMRRLRDAEESLHTSLDTLSQSGVHGQAIDARVTADHVASALRRVADRLVAVESTIAPAPQEQQDALREDVRDFRVELDEGVEGYGALVAAAGRAVAADGGLESKHDVQEATDRLAGLARTLDQLSNDRKPGDLGTGRGTTGELPS